MKRLAFAFTGTAVVLFTGCANISSASLEESFKKTQATKGGLKEYLVEVNKNDYHGVKIFADKPNETILRTRVFNPNGVGISDIYEVTDQLSFYCKKIGGNWIYGKQYGYLLKRLSNAYVNPTLVFQSTSQQLKAEESNYNGFGKCEAGENSFEVKYEMGRFAINTINWSRFYKLTFSKPQKSSNDFVVKSHYALLHKSPTFKSWDSFINYANKHKDFGAFGKGANFLANSYIMCLSKGGEMYIANQRTNNKKMNFSDYVFKVLDEYHKKYPKGTDGSGIRELSLFATVGKNYYWCENKNPQYEFSFTSYKDKYGWKRYLFKPYVDEKLKNMLRTNNIKTFNSALNKTNANLQKNNNILNKITSSLGKLTTNTKVDDKSALNIAKGMFITKSNINVTNSPYVKYYGKYIGKIGSCEYASVEKQSAGVDKIYNFRKCNGTIEYTGQKTKLR